MNVCDSPGSAVPDLHRALRERFGFDSFLDGQENVIRRVLAGEDLLVVRPTGSGKSLCYQLPALLAPPLTVVVSPLIALMKDQVDALAARDAAAATFINSSLEPDEQRRRLRDAMDGRYRLLYVAPERFRLAGFLNRLREARIQRFVVDEAHCISEWGHDFRPDYRRLREVLDALGGPPLLALTATATVAVQADIATQLGREQLPRVVSGFNRPNLSFEVRAAAEEAMKWRHLEELLGELPGSGILYAATRRQTEAVAAFVAQRTDRPVVAYHAGFDSGHRTTAQDQFMASPDALAVATNAFGMGVDKPDVRFVIHCALPGSIEAYYQQAGRAGRDGRPARCILLYDPADRGLQNWFIEHDVPNVEQLAGVLGELTAGPASLDLLATRGDAGDAATRQILDYLERIGAVTAEPNGESGPRFRLTRAQLTPAERREFETMTRDRLRQRQRQLDDMVRYAETGRGRRAFLLGYFGEPTPPDPAWESLDNPAPPPPDPREVTPEETEVARLILECIAAARSSMGRAKLVQVLRGSKATGITGWMRQLPGYGRLAAFRSENLRDAIDHLVFRGFLRTVGSEFPTLATTEPGLAVLADPHALVAVPCLRGAAAVLAAEPTRKLRDPAVSDLSEDSEGRFQVLRDWRAATARAVSLPPYMVLSDKTLRLLARAQPRSHLELLQIPGIGPYKAEQYGAKILEALGSAPTADPTPAAVAEPAFAAPARTLPELADELRDRLLAGEPPEEAANHLGIGPTRLGNLIASLIGAGEIELEQVLPATTVQAIQTVLAEAPDRPLGEIKSRLPGEISYAAIRWVREAARHHPTPQGPWSRVWHLRSAEVGETLTAGDVPAHLAQIAPLTPRAIDLAIDLGRRWGVPVQFALTAGAPVLSRLATPLLLLGDHEAVVAACGRLAEVQPLWAAILAD